MEKKYDYIIVGCGLFGATFAQCMTERGKKCLIVEKRGNIGGLVYTKKRGGIHLHIYGPHIFHTDKKEVWDYINRFGNFRRYTLNVKATFKDKIYSLPFNLNTFQELWSIKTPLEAIKKIKEQRVQYENGPQNLEEQALSSVGKDIYKTLIKGYTEKQWGKDCTELPASIIKRIPFLLKSENDYFPNDDYEAVPVDGYTDVIQNMIKGCDVLLNTKWADIKDSVEYGKLIYTGPIDEYFNYSEGDLEWRSLYWKQVHYYSPFPCVQSAALMNYTDRDVPYTRIIEHNYLNPKPNLKANDVYDIYQSYEYPVRWDKTKEPFYPINDDKNQILFEKYKELAKQEKNVIFGGRLGNYRYYDMDDVIYEALELSKKEYEEM